MTSQVRPRQDADLPALAQALVKVHAVDGYPVEGVANPIGWLTPPRLIAAWSGSYNGKPVGHAALTQATSDDDAARIWQEQTGASIDRLAIPVRLFVHPNHRRHGLGQMLFDAVLAHVRDHELAAAFDVMLKDQAAIRLYEAAGCIRLGTITHRHSEGQTEPGAVYAIPMA